MCRPFCPAFLHKKSGVPSEARLKFQSDQSICYPRRQKPLGRQQTQLKRSCFLARCTRSSNSFLCGRPVGRVFRVLLIAIAKRHVASALVIVAHLKQNVAFINVKQRRIHAFVRTQAVQLLIISAWLYAATKFLRHFFRLTVFSNEHVLQRVVVAHHLSPRSARWEDNAY